MTETGAMPTHGIHYWPTANAANRTFDGDDTAIHLGIIAPNSPYPLFI